MPTGIRFRVNQDKVLEALVHVARARPGIDVFHVCKVLYFADKKHLNVYGRPILGDRYFALKQGPVPTLAYDMIERDERHLNGDLLDRLSSALSYYKSENDSYIRITALREAESSLFSDSDIECLDESITAYADIDSNELIRLVHAEPAYQEVYKEGRKIAEIEYERIIESENPLRDEIVKDMREMSAFVIL
jgi:uncharacterized phage-associated protein